MYYQPYNHPAYQHTQKSPAVFRNQFPPSRQYPSVDTTILSQSVKESQILLQQGELLLDQLDDNSYSLNLMDAAQQGNQEEVNRMIHSIDGLYVPVQTTYTPSGIIFNLQSPGASQDFNCCSLKMTLKWGK